MAALEGDFKHIHEQTEGAVVSTSWHNDERRDEVRCQPFNMHRIYTGHQGRVPPIKAIDREVELLVILTLAKPPNSPEFLAITVKSVRGIGDEEKPFVKLYLYHGIHMLGKARSGLQRRPKSLESAHRMASEYAAQGPGENQIEEGARLFCVDVCLGSCNSTFSEAMLTLISQPVEVTRTTMADWSGQHNAPSKSTTRHLEKTIKAT